MLYPLEVEKGFLEKKQESLQKGIDDWVANQGDSKLAMAGGALATALNQVFFPTAWYELIPAGRGFKLMKKGKKGVAAAIKARKAEANSGGHHFCCIYRASAQ
jgi:hypothetical protein